MFKLSKLITLVPGTDTNAFVSNAKAVAEGLPEIKRALAAPTLPGVYNGGDVIWHMQFQDAAAYRACIAKSGWADVGALLGGKDVLNVESAAYEGGLSGAKQPGLKNGVYRILFLSVKAATPEQTVLKFEAETRAMPDYISSIQNWQLSRVSAASGARPWTHVWEQEYADISGLYGPYMMHPYHWGHIDRWFNPECADWIVDTYLCHTFCTFESGVISPP